MRGRLVRRLFVALSALVLIPACGTGSGGGGSTPVAPPGAFTLSSPANNAVGQPVSPSLTWTDSAGAASYVLQISIDNTFFPVIFEQRGIGTTSTTPPVVLGHSEAYYWRVAAVNAAGSVVATNGPFRFDTLAPPGATPTAPTLSQAGNLTSRAPSFTWTGGSNAVTWTLQIDESGGDWSTLVRQMTGLRASSATLDVVLARNSAFKARVLAVNGANTAVSNEVNFTTSSADVGDFDADLGGTGRLVSAFAGQANAVAIDDNGDIYLAGSVSTSTALDVAVFKMKPDGTADPFFGSNGLALADFDGLNDGAIAILIDASKRVVVAGYSTNGSLRQTMAVLRFTPAGVLDATFHGDGKSRFDGVDNTNIGSNNTVSRGVAAWNTGYVIAGDDNTTSNVYFARMDGSGALDNTFGTGGIGTVTAVGTNPRLSGLKAEGTTSLVGVGSVQQGSGDLDMALFKVDANGAAVAGFGTNGVKVQALEGALWDAGQGLVIDGSTIVVAGFKATLTNNDLSPVLCRFQLADGVLVTTDVASFGVQFSSLDSANAIARTSTGTYVTAGLATQPGPNADFGFFRFESDGDVDPAFGASGKVRDVGSTSDEALGVALDLHGRIVATGVSGGRMAVVRLFNAP